jgi:AAA+ superfamily predicted ATPase
MDAIVEIDYLKRLIEYRLDNPSGQDAPPLPPIAGFTLPIKDFIIKNKLGDNADLISLLLIGLAPHVAPHLFDEAIQSRLNEANNFPAIGGVRGKNFRGLLPTGQTALYLLAGGDVERHRTVSRLFWSDQYLAKKKILWLEDLPHGEPVMSGKIIMATDYTDLFVLGTAAPPNFGAGFPAKKIGTKLSLADIVMNEEVKAHYLNLKTWIDNNESLTTDWDKKERLRKGFRVLFYGPPGTGKTLTANILGTETKKEVYRVDLSMVVSKYIGETEKNLELLFARAEDKNWILFFDEADAIFGKRTGVRDAHDKYANQEVSYLLQRIEDYNGMVILATNMKNNIDDAFIRRFNDIVKFTIPDENQRAEIWQKSFPEDAEFGDIHDRVKKYELTGGNIVNVIHFASIRAVQKRSEQKKADRSKKLQLHLEDVVEGIKREYIKEGRPFTR